MVEQIARRTVFVDDAPLIKVTIDRFEDRDTAGSLMHGEALGRRELEPLRELVRDLGRARLV